MASIYMGLPDPILKPHGELLFRDRSTMWGERFQTVDPYGHSLSNFMGMGHGRVTLHNELENTAKALARLVGFVVDSQPADIFNSAISPARREAFEAAQRAAQRKNRGGLVPDLRITGFHLPGRSSVVPVDRFYDLKTIGFRPRVYYGRIGRRAPDVRAATVGNEYERLARDVDRRYNGVPPDTDGPVLQLLRSLPPVTGLAVGAFGEWSREVDTFISDLAEKGASRPERFGCCHGQKQARGVIAAFARSVLGRVSLRGVARVRHTALAVARGIRRGGDSPGFADAFGAHNAWDAERCQPGGSGAG